MTLRTLIVDDEPYARAWLRRGLAEDPEIEIIGESADGPSAVDAILRSKPEVVLLDVQMPGMDGFAVLESIPEAFYPRVIFTTAFEQYAVRAFEAHAVDYLLKPIRLERLHESLDRVKDLVREHSSDAVQAALRDVLAEVREQQAQSQWLLIKKDDHSVFLRMTDIDWIEAARNKVILHAGKERYDYREPISALAGRLDTGMFLRIHRSTVVNVTRVLRVDSWLHGEYAVILADGTRLTMSEPYRRAIKAFRRFPNSTSDAR